MEMLTVKNLSFTYPNTDAPTVKNLSFSVREGEFIVLCGATGSGKSTLLRLLKRELAPRGELSGEISFEGVDTRALSDREAAMEIGYVMQRPEEQIVTDKVWHELAFGLENEGLPQNTIRRRVSEMASYFGIEDWFLKDVSSLSGGQKQLLNLASVMVTGPKLLLLDEPTAQLDPIAASEFIATIVKLNRELSLTVILIEHRLEEVIPLCDRLMVLENGSLLAFDAPRNAVKRLSQREDILLSMPAAVRLFFASDGDSLKIPLNIREGRAYLETNFANEKKTLPKEAYTPSGTEVLSFSHVYFRYEKNMPDVLSGLDFSVYENEIFTILGGNGSGKTTTLGTAAGLLRPYSGKVRVFGKKLSDYKNGTLYQNGLSYLPQDVQTVFLKNTVREELAEVRADIEAFPYDLSHLLDKHPYDISGGERQLVAMAKLLAGNPRLVLLDEPTKGLDAHAKSMMEGVLRDLKARGVTIIIVTHDIEFAAAISDRVALFFRGELVSLDTPRAFFSENHFYTTAVSRMTRGYYEGAVTLSDAVALCRANPKKKREASLCL